MPKPWRPSKPLRAPVSAVTEIAKEARQLFNKRGFMATSFRGIAEALEISPGHLHYHYKNKEALLTALFQELVDATEAMFAEVAEPATLSARWFGLQRQYFFFFRELPALLVAFPSLRRRYQAIAKKRIGQFVIMFESLQTAGLVAPEPEPGFFQNFAELLWQQSNSVLSLLSISHGAGSVKRAETLLDALILPILTKAGRAAYRAR